MIRYRSVLTLPFVIGWLACGGATFAPDFDGGGGSGGQGGGGVAGTGTTSTTQGVTSGPATGPGTSAVTSATTTTASTTSSTTTASGGASGAGGSGGVGGRAGSGGQVVDSGRDVDADSGRDASPACDAGTPTPVTFHLSQAVGASYCTGFCGTINWVTVLPPDGGPAFTLTAPCMMTCDVCQPIPCAGAAAADPPAGAPLPPDPKVAPPGACAPPQPFPATGLTFNWNGVLWTPGQCGVNNYACVNRTCGTPPGKYIARMCANRRVSDAGSFCMYDPIPTCVDVPFEYPATTVVEGVLR